MYSIYNAYTDRWTSFGNVLRDNHIEIHCSYNFPILTFFWTNINTYLQTILEFFTLKIQNIVTDSKQILIRPFKGLLSAYIFVIDSNNFVFLYTSTSEYLQMYVIIKENINITTFRNIDSLQWVAKFYKLCYFVVWKTGVGAP